MSRASTARRVTRSRAFTLPEVLIATFLNAVAILGIMTTYMMLIRNGLNIAGYSDIETEVRRGFEQFGTDARMASSIYTGSVGNVTYLTLNVKNNYTTTNGNVTYAFDSTNKYFYLVPGNSSALGNSTISGYRSLIGASGTTNSLTAPKVVSFGFVEYKQDGTQLYDSTAGSGSADDTDTKHIQIKMTVQRSASGGNTATESVASAEYTMRNKT